MVKRARAEHISRMTKRDKAMFCAGAYFALGTIGGAKAAAVRHRIAMLTINWDAYEQFHASNPLALEAVRKAESEDR